MGTSPPLLGFFGRLADAYWDYQTRSVQAVVVATGAETVLGPRPNGAASAARLNASGGWQLIEALDSGVYAVPSSYPATPGLWLFPMVRHR